MEPSSTRSPPDDSFDYAAARKRLDERYARKAEARRRLAEQAARDAEEIVKRIREKYPVKRILQWGSVLEPRHFSEASDIDLAIEGLDSLTFSQLFAEMEPLTRFPLDLVHWETLNPHFQTIIKQKARVIYEKE